VPRWSKKTGHYKRELRKGKNGCRLVGCRTGGGRGGKKNRNRGEERNDLKVQFEKKGEISLRNHKRTLDTSPRLKGGVDWEEEEKNSGYPYLE